MKLALPQLLFVAQGGPIDVYYPDRPVGLHQCDSLVSHLCNAANRREKTGCGSDAVVLRNWCVADLTAQSRRQRRLRGFGVVATVVMHEDVSKETVATVTSSLNDAIAANSLAVVYLIGGLVKKAVIVDKVKQKRPR